MSDHTETNPRLNAAAPKLLEALTDALRAYDKQYAMLPISKRPVFPPIWVCKAMRAIAAAEKE